MVLVFLCLPIFSIIAVNLHWADLLTLWLPKVCRAFLFYLRQNPVVELFFGLVGLCVGTSDWPTKMALAADIFLCERSITIKYLMGGRNFKPDVELVGVAPSD